MLRSNLILSILILLGFTIILTNELSAKTTIPEGQWEEMVKDKAFLYKDKKESETITPTVSQPNILTKFLAIIYNLASSTIGRTIIWAALILFIGYVLYATLFRSKTRLQKQKKNLQKNSLATPEEKDILHTDWEQEIQQAVAEGNTRLVIRYRYMQLLQLLQKEQMIRFRSDKTNQDYYNEIHNTGIKTTFRKLSQQYEYAWYGDYPVTNKALDAFSLTFSNLKAQLDK